MQLENEFEVAVEVKVVRAYEVHSHTSKGWLLHAVVESEEVQTEDLLKETLDKQYRLSLTEQVAVKIRTPLFILTREESHAKMARELGEAQRTAEKAERERETLLSTVEKKKEEVDLLHRTMQKIEDIAKKRLADLGDLQLKLEKYEEDLGKLRTALGTKQVDLILTD